MRKEEAAFIGKITAAMTHEFMNVLSTIKEASGLMEDLLELSGETSFPHREKFSKKLVIVREQVKRGMEISGMLNKFAHSMDEPEPWIEINELLRQLSILVQRFAKLKEIELTLNPFVTPLEIRVDPFRLQLVLVACLEYCFDHTACGGKVTMEAQRREKEMAIQCLMEPDSKSMETIDEVPHKFAGLQETLHHLNARLVPINRPEQRGLELVLRLEPNHHKM
jgi:C4-dicarboxylate-specific signal transduction histidine kinase